jgi:hypothetical protein
MAYQLHPLEDESNGSVSDLLTRGLPHGCCFRLLRIESGSITPLLPEIPSTDLGLSMEVELSLDSIMPPSDPQ